MRRARFAAPASDGHTCGLRTDDTVACWRILPSRVEESFTAQVELGDDFDFGDHAIIVNGTSHPLSL